MSRRAPPCPFGLPALLTLALCASARASGPAWPDLTRPARAEASGASDAAVVIGIEHYDAVPGVPGAVAGANDWYAFLTRGLQVPPSRVTLLRDREATLEKMRKYALEASRQVQPGGTLWFIFIGHGAPAADGKDGVLVGYDAQQDVDSLYARSLPQRELLGLLGKGAPHRNLVALDACFSGRSGSGEALVQGLQPLLPVAGRLGNEQTTLLTAGRADQFAGPLPGLGRPAFSYLLLGALRGWADQDRDGRVTAREAVQYVQDALKTVVRDRSQVPELIGSGSQALSRANEAGPDLTSLVLALGPGGGEPALPAPTEPRSTARPAFGGTNLALEEAYDQALSAEESEATSALEKEQAWCRLAQTRAANPHLSEADEACSRWRSYNESVRDRMQYFWSDYQKLRGFLALKHKTTDERLQQVNRFLDSYDDLPPSPALEAVHAAWATLNAARPASLPDLSPPAR